MHTAEINHAALHRLQCETMSNQANDPPAVRAILRIENSLGLHARPAALFVRIANQFCCEILVSNGDEVVVGKSILGLLMLGAAKGSFIEVMAVGEGAQEAISALSELVKKGFGED